MQAVVRQLTTTIRSRICLHSLASLSNLLAIHYFLSHSPQQPSPRVTPRFGSSREIQAANSPPHKLTTELYFAHSSCHHSTKHVATSPRGQSRHCNFRYRECEAYYMQASTDMSEFYQLYKYHKAGIRSNRTAAEEYKTLISPLRHHRNSRTCLRSR